ncbi:paraquat-inducible protein A [Methylobrevis pamukkalensis]|uniref:Paraquat-inducible protein A n=1 Tax=Methylobrevis pamukkalensis TaxID=1439726 RepID=A0A1E3H2I8_9HYPH|nr:paraquat-inducible protein A [Methylobrevis pamukkalensis]ODN70016.1 Paraquat-inducible protein A [Methylobrevis pamukkalensis]
MRHAFALSLLVATLCLPLGLTLPLLTLDRLYVFTETPSLIAVVAGLWGEGDLLLALVVGLGSVVFPLAKLAVLFLAGLGAEGRLLSHLQAIGRWSLMDVVLVALVVFAAKTSGLATAVTEPGLWFYGASTVGAALASLALERLRAREGQG